MHEQVDEIYVVEVVVESLQDPFGSPCTWDHKPDLERNAKNMIKPTFSCGHKRSYDLLAVHSAAETILWEWEPCNVIGRYVIPKGDYRIVLLIWYLTCSFISETAGVILVPFIGLFKAGW
jgi:hypothetical protein